MNHARCFFVSRVTDFSTKNITPCLFYVLGGAQVGCVCEGDFLGKKIGGSSKTLSTFWLVSSS